jgi:hypothetical protein
MSSWRVSLNDRQLLICREEPPSGNAGDHTHIDFENVVSDIGIYLGLSLVLRLTPVFGQAGRNFTDGNIGYGWLAR